MPDEAPVMTMTLFWREPGMGDEADGSIARCVDLEGKETGRKGGREGGREGGWEVIGAYALVGQVDQLLYKRMPYVEWGLRA